jgi:hypothetical protein
MPQILFSFPCILPIVKWLNTMIRIPSLGQDHPEQPPTVPGSIEDTFAKAAEKRRRITYLAIPAIIAAGLLIAVIYIGVRVMSAKPHTAPVQTHAVIVIPPAGAPAITPPANPPEVAKKERVVAKPERVAEKKDKPVRAGNAPLTLITPQAGETYLQLAAVGPSTVLRYLDELRQSDLEPSVAPGPTPGLLRVVVGPFPDASSLSRAKARLDAVKIVWIIRAY